MNTCFFCGGELEVRETTFVFEDDSELSIIRNVPAFVCVQCGDKEYRQETTARVLAGLRHPPRPLDILHVPAYALAPA
jgi:YgiT-type zinc finger domain-containing protein